jgi:hypothetical protein
LGSRGVKETRLDGFSPSKRALSRSGTFYKVHAVI